jgi:hypothetical protein
VDHESARVFTCQESCLNLPPTRAKSTSEYRCPMKRSDLKPGMKLRVVRDRWEVLRGTLAEVESVRYVDGPPGRTWYFRVWWLLPESTGGREISRNLFLEDLNDFEVLPKTFRDLVRGIRGAVTSRLWHLVRRLQRQ